MATQQVKPPIYGIMAEFETPQELYDAVRKSKADGYHQLDAYMPYPVEEISHEVCDHQKSVVSKIVLVGGVIGCLFGFFFQCWAMGVDAWWMAPIQNLTYELFGYTGYPFNIGGRPLFSWPAFIPVAFELTILFGAFSAVIGMFMVNGLPQPYHPVFNVPSFERASVDRFFLVIESSDPQFDRAATRVYMEGLGPQEVNDVDW